MILTQNASGNPLTDPDTARIFAEATGATVPITGDLSSQAVLFLPWPGNSIPGKCVLSPQMEIITCYTGTNDDQGVAAIQAHAAGM